MELTPWLIVVFTGVFLALALFILNTVIAVKRDGAESFPVTIAMHVVGIATILANAGRLSQTPSDALMIGHAIAILVTAVSLRRTFRRKKGGHAAQ